MQDDSIDQDRQMRQARDVDQARQAEQRRLEDERERLRLEEEEEQRQRGRSDAPRTSRRQTQEGAAASGAGLHSRFGSSAAALSAQSAGTDAAPGRVKAGKSSLPLLGLLVVTVAACAGSWLAFSDRGSALRHEFFAAQPLPSEDGARQALEPTEAPLAGPALPQVAAADQSLLTPAPAPLAGPASAAAPEPAPAATAPADSTISGNAASGTPALDVEQRLQTIETMLAGIQAQLGRVESARVSAATAPAPAPRPSTPRPHRNAAASGNAPAKPTPAVAAEPSPPRMAGQLLAVDVWGGAPSVVVGTGDPGDRRIRVLRPGDTHNGVSLLRADPATGQATFAAGTATFTMMVKDGS